MNGLFFPVTRPALLVPPFADLTETNQSTCPTGSSFATRRTDFKYSTSPTSSSLVRRQRNQTLDRPSWLHLLDRPCWFLSWSTSKKPITRPAPLLPITTDIIESSVGRPRRNQSLDRLSWFHIFDRPARLREAAIAGTLCKFVLVIGLCSTCMALHQSANGSRRSSTAGSDRDSACRCYETWLAPKPPKTTKV